MRAAAVVLLLATAFLTLSGCFDRRELNTLGIVIGVGIDKAETEGDTELTLQFADIAGHRASSGGKASKGGGAERLPYINVSNTGENINYLIRDMQHKMSRRVYLAHSQVIIMGEELAKQGVRDSLDFFARVPEARMTLYVFVAQGKAKDVLDVKPEFETTPSHEISQLIKDQKLTSQTPIVTEFEFVSKMTSKTTAAIAPIIRILEEGDKKMLSCAGSAVFKESVMVGELDEKQTRGMLFVNGEVKTGIINLNVLDTPASLEIRKAKSKVTPTLYDDGSVLFQVQIDEMGGLGDQTGTVNLSDPDNVPAVLSATEQAIKDEVQSAVDKSKELNADIFGFGEYIYRKYPKQWEEMKDKWDELYKNIKVEINVKCKADGNGRIVMPLAPEGA